MAEDYNCIVSMIHLGRKVEGHGLEVYQVERRSDLLAEAHKDKEVASDAVCSQQITPILSYINENYAEKLTLESISKQFFLDYSHLSRIFKSSVGLTFSDYLRKFRIQKAIELMMESDKNIAEIAMAVGFRSSNHFCKTFRALLGVSPLKYKKGYLRQRENTKEK